MCSIQRLNEAYEYLRDRGKVHTKKELAEAMGANRVNISKAFNGDEKYLTKSFLTRFNSTFGNVFNIGWLLGEDDKNMLRIGGDDEAVAKIIEFMNFPFVSQRAYAGYTSGFADPEYIESLPTVAFPVDHSPMGNYMVFEVKGDSMYDGTHESYIEGDLLLCREIKMDLWAESKLHFKKWDFVIVTGEGVLVKRIINHDVAGHKITIHSLNPAYPDKDIDLTEVRQILNVISMMRPRRR